jgi:hypothetical protein
MIEEQKSACYLLNTGLFIDPENGGDQFFQNIG